MANKVSSYLWIVIVISVVSLWLGYIDNKNVSKKLDSITDRIRENSAALEVAKNKFEIREKEISIEKRNKLNQEVWSETGCLRCHNYEQNQLPIYNRNIDDAIKIVRVGTPHTISEGMPTYSKTNSRNSTSITDTELRFRLQNLYTPEFIKLAKDLPQDIDYKVNDHPPDNTR